MPPPTPSSASGQRLRSGITVVDVTNGNVVAMVGDMGKKEGDMVWNYATDAHQQCDQHIVGQISVDGLYNLQ